MARSPSWLVLCSLAHQPPSSNDRAPLVCTGFKSMWKELTLSGKIRTFFIQVWTKKMISEHKQAPFLWF